MGILILKNMANIETFSSSINLYFLKSLDMSLQSIFKSAEVEVFLKSTTILLLSGNFQIAVTEQSFY